MNVNLIAVREWQGEIGSIDSYMVLKYIHKKSHGDRTSKNSYMLADSKGIDY